MPYSRITRTVAGADAIAYARGDGTGHNDNAVRNEYIGCINMLPDSVVSFERQMQPFWDRADSRHIIQVDRCIVSFHPSELDPDKPEDCAKGLAIGCEIARRNAPDNQSAVFLQKDGKGRKIHLHILTNDVNMSDYKGIDSKAYAHFHFQKIVDKVCEQYFDLVQSDAQPEKVNPSVRGSRIKNEQIRAANELERQRAAEEGREVDPDKIKAERYIWQDDLRQRVKDAAARATNEQSFAHQLRLSGVELVPVKNKDKQPIRDENGNLIYLHPATKKQPAYYTYELVDISGFPDKIPPNLKSKSHKLGTNYQPENIAKLFTGPGLTSQEERKEQAPPVVMEMPMPSPKLKRKPAQTPATTKETPSEDKEMEEAKKQAAYYILTIMQQIYGWQATPKSIDADGKEHIDFREWDHQLKERDNAFEQFTRWSVDRQTELAKDGLKLPAIYVKDKETGHISVPHAELEAQFRDFLDRRAHPKTYTAIQEQPQAEPTGQTIETPTDQRQQPQAKTAPDTPKEQAAPAKQSHTEQERQKIETQRSALMDEIMRISAANERRWRKQQASEEEDYDTP